MLWQSIKKQLQQKIPENVYSLWISPVTAEEQVDDSLVLTGPDTFFCDRFQDNVMGPIQECLQELGHGQVKVSLEAAVGQQLSGSPRTRQMRLPAMEKVAPFTKTLHPRYTFSEFMVGECNALAHSACQALADDRPALGNCIYVNGGTGLGKSHLAQSVAHHIVGTSPQTRMQYVTAQQLTVEMVKGIKANTMGKFRSKYQRNCDVLLIEDVQALAGRAKTQAEFAETLDLLMESGKRVVMTSSKGPAEIENLDPGLRSRLSLGLVTTINPPGFATREKIIRRKAGNSDLLLSEDLVGYIAENVKGDIRRCESIIVGLKAQTALLGCDPDLDMVKQILQGIVGAGRQITPEMIRDFIAGKFRVTINDLQSKSRKRAIAFPRQVAMYLARKHTEYPLSEIGKALNRDHSTVVHSVKTINNKINRDGSVRGQLEHLSDQLEKKFL
ncbi:MAG: chromosomal replication initiator protein DnaA [Thermodesulfobacteriota bacterium]